MTETVFYVAGLLLAVYGAGELLWRIVGRLFAFEEEERVYLLVPMSGERSDAEYQVRRARLLCRGGAVQPVLLDDGLTPQSAALTREICEKLNADFVDKKEWQEILQTALQDEKKGV